MIFSFVSVIVPFVVLFTAPVIMKWLGYTKTAPKWLLPTTCLLFGVSFYLPSPLIDGVDTHFTTHFLGGGVFCALLWHYVKIRGGIKLPWPRDLALLYFLTSGLGVANELFELVVWRSGLSTGLDPSDTWWDFLANTLGALAGWIVLRVATKRYR